MKTRKQITAQKRNWAKGRIIGVLGNLNNMKRNIPLTEIEEEYIDIAISRLDTCCKVWQKSFKPKPKGENNG